MKMENPLFLGKHRLVLQFGKGQVFEYDKNLIITDLVEQHANTQPDAVAVQFQQVSLSYKQLHEASNKLAHYLVRQGVHSKTHIATYLEPSLNLIISLLAILKTGSCYVPLDIHYPPERLSYLFQQSNTSLLITQSDLRDKLRIDCSQIIELDKYGLSYADEAIENLFAVIHPEDNVYIMYTSGSTGVPKGVAIHHHAMMNHMTWMQHHFKLDTSDVILLKTPISFDPSVWEVFLPLFMGAKLIISPERAYLSPDILVKLINQHSITIIQFVPSLLEQFLKNLDNPCFSLRNVFVGGESLTKEIKELFFNKLPHCQLHNLYGPTETTIEIAAHTVSSSALDRHTDIIGKPIYNTQLYVLNADGRLVDILEEGELYIAGDSVSYGYYANEQETRKSFMDDHFSPQTPRKMYRTGDIVKWSHTGNLIYVGRNNDQMKINGVRVEPNEIATHVLDEYPVSHCVVTKRLDEKGYAFLACYLLPKESVVLNIFDIHNKLKRFFPSAMLPKRYALMTAVPLTINGKVDFSALPVPTIIPTSLQPVSTLKPVTTVEKKLVHIWENILNLENIPIEGNFFELGGHSIMGFQLLHYIQSEFKVDISIKDIFLYPTISSQLEQINVLITSNKKETYQHGDDILIPLQTQGTKTPLFLIHPIGGTIFWYTLLALALDENRPVYGIQDPGILLKKTCFSSIEEMATCYLNKIKQVQPCGPYIVGGASFGATVALEVAHLFRKQNEKIIIIPILDGWAIYPDTLREDEYFKLSMKRQHADWKKQFNQYHLPDPDDLFQLQWHRLSLLWKYHLPDIQSPIALFKAQELLPAFSAIEAPLNHWEKFTRLSIELYQVPGNHETMFQKPHVITLANHLKHCLNSRKET